MWTVDGEKLRRLRKSSGFTQAELADQAGTSEKTIRRYEASRPARNIDVLARIARVLHVTGTDLVLSKEVPGREPFAELGWLSQWCESQPTAIERFRNLLPNAARGETAFLGAVRRCLKRNCLPGVQVFALCSKKSDDAQVEGYFQANYDLAREVRRLERGVERAIVQRIFVELAGGFDANEKKFIAEHVEHSRDGVVASVVLERDAPEIPAGCLQALENGFGFVLVCSSSENVAFLHHGFGKQMGFSKIQDFLTVADLRLFFREIEAFSVSEVDERWPF